MLGRTDEPPTGDGIDACRARAAKLEVDRVIASDLTRASAAGAAIAGAHGLGCLIDPRWRELDFGDWDGKTSTDLDAQALGRFWDDPDACPPPQGERWSALTARVAAAIGDLPTSPTLVVTHAGAMRAAVHLLCGIDRRALWAFDFPYAALLSLRLWPGEAARAQIIGLQS